MVGTPGDTYIHLEKRGAGDRWRESDKPVGDSAITDGSTTEIQSSPPK